MAFLLLHNYTDFILLYNSLITFHLLYDTLNYLILDVNIRFFYNSQIYSSLLYNAFE